MHANETINIYKSVLASIVIMYMSALQIFLELTAALEQRCLMHRINTQFFSNPGETVLAYAYAYAYVYVFVSTSTHSDREIAIHLDGLFDHEFYLLCIVHDVKLERKLHNWNGRLHSKLVFVVKELQQLLMPSVMPVSH